jgi:hypothetical protein
VDQDRVASDLASLDEQIKAAQERGDIMQSIALKHHKYATSRTRTSDDRNAK